MQNAAARNRIAAKHGDFLLCDPATLRPLAGIELEDASHARPDRQERDARVEKVFEAAGLSLVQCGRGKGRFGDWGRGEA